MPASPKPPASPRRRAVLRAGALAAPALLLGACAGEGQDAVRVVRIASLSAPKTPWHDLWLRFVARFRAADPADLRLELFITGELGGEEGVLANLRRGRIQIGGFSLQGLATVVPELSLLLTPYLFVSREEVDFVMDNYLVPAFAELFRRKGIEPLVWSEVGWTNIYSRIPILTPEDAAGVPMRASNAVGSRVFAEAIGADSIPVSFAETLPALQTGLIESGQSGTGMYAIFGMSREAKHYTLTRHAIDTGVTVANLDWWQSLRQDQRTLIINSMDSVQEGRENIRTAVDGLLRKTIADPTLSVHHLTPAQDAAWRAAARDTHEAVIRQTGGETARLYALAQAGKRAFAEAGLQHSPRLDDG